MKIYLGDTGLDKSWQAPFPEITKCHKCGEKARIMFVVFEGSKSKRYVSDIRENGGKGDYWVHDAIACAVYLCAYCFSPITILNQA
ncbi:hypothetical protein ES695_05435 [Candidatus Atribacteria bacterium 1244-E10-H5-B2]|nr:MAG: hypothetical protein ES695_05435 [Candidatus Atribacteria bacterium 1244-E10-H5-B2]